MKGLIYTLKFVNNGACVHEKANVMQTMVFYVKLIEKGSPAPGDMERVIERAKKLIKRYAVYPKDPGCLYDPEEYKKDYN
jgi:hypothetical protein